MVPSSGGLEGGVKGAQRWVDKGAVMGVDGVRVCGGVCVCVCVCVVCVCVSVCVCVCGVCVDVVWMGG